jgi:hypothetical protein
LITLSRKQGVAGSRGCGNDKAVPWVSGGLPGSVGDKKTVPNVAW